MSLIACRPKGNADHVEIDYRGSIRCCFLTTSALAIGLTADDLEYLSRQGVEKGSPLIQGLSPKEIASLHALINDVRTKDMRPPCK